MKFKFVFMHSYDVWWFYSGGCNISVITFSKWFKIWNRDRIEQTKQLKELLTLLIEASDENTHVEGYTAPAVVAITGNTDRST